MSVSYISPYNVESPHPIWVLPSICLAIRMLRYQSPLWELLSLCVFIKLSNITSKVVYKWTEIVKMKSSLSIERNICQNNNISTTINIKRWNISYIICDNGDVLDVLGRTSWLWTTHVVCIIF